MSPRTAAEVRYSLQWLVAEHLGQPLDKVTDAAGLREDLGADSLDRLDLVLVVENQFGLTGGQITDLEAMAFGGEIETFGALVGAVCKVTGVQP